MPFQGPMNPVSSVTCGRDDLVAVVRDAPGLHRLRAVPRQRALLLERQQLADAKPRAFAKALDPLPHRRRPRRLSTTCRRAASDATQPILASRAPLESPMGTTCPPPPPWLQASRPMTTRDEPGCPSRRSGAAGCRRIRIRPMKCLHFIDFVDFGRLRALRPRRQTPPQTHLRAQDAHISPYSDLATLLGLLG